MLRANTANIGVLKRGNHGSDRMTRRGVAVAALLACAWSTPVTAQPTAGKVIAGQATINALSSTSTLIRQSSGKAIITWSGFSISAGASVIFQQPGPGSIVLNRVTGGVISNLMGTLSANGQVWLVNPAGIVVGSGAHINVAGLLLSTADLSNGNFLSGNYNFNIPGNPGAAVVNHGQIVAASGGSVVLGAPQVTNDGLVEAELGTVVVAGAKTFAVDFAGDNLLSFAITGPVTQVAQGTGALVANGGTLAAQGGRVLLTASAAKGVLDNVINVSGIVEATSASVGANGQIVLSGSGGAVTVSGTLDASGKGAGQTGGTVEVLGDRVNLAAGAKIDVSGDAGGGTALVGGNFHGAGPQANAAITTVAAGATIDADAITSGNGGRVAVWSEDATDFAGSITARGGAEGGNGGYVETSGQLELAFTGSVDLRAPHGQMGMLLLDPQDLDIVNDEQTPEAGASSILDTTLEGALANGNVTLATNNSSGSQSGDIAVATNITWVSGTSLTLEAYRNITLDAGVTIANTSSSSGAGLVLRADSIGTGTGTVIFDDGAEINFANSAGTVAIYYNPVSNPAGSLVNSTSYVAGSGTAGYSGGSPGYAGGEVLLGSGSTLTAYMLVNTVYDLQNIENNPAGSYALGASIDASATAGWNSGAGFIPIGNSEPFTGTLVGTSPTGTSQTTISNLTINSGAGNVGLFGTIGPGATVSNLALVNANVTGTAANANVGGLAGTSYGTIASVTVGGSVTAASADAVGGLVGIDEGPSITGAIANVAVSGGAYSDGNVAGFGHVGALVGLVYDTSSIASSSATGAVTGGVGSDVGGLVGTAYANLTLTDDFATGAVTGGPAGPEGGGSVGGLIGASFSTPILTVVDSYATGAVNGGGQANVGGLVGIMDSGTISASYATGAVSSSQPGSSVGGLLGNSYTDSVTISQSYATGEVWGASDSIVGGLVGFNNGEITQSFAIGAVNDVSAHAVGGLVGTNFNDGSIIQSFATGAASGGSGKTGGLAGINQGYIDDSFAQGTVSGGSDGASVGGLVGQSVGGAIIEVYATGAVSGGDYTGGLIGYAYGTTLETAYWATDTTGQAIGIGFNPYDAVITGLTAAQLKAGLPSDFDPTIWGESSAVLGGFPHLLQSGSATIGSGAGGEVSFTVDGVTYIAVTGFGQNNDIQTDLIASFPVGEFVAGNALATPFEIVSSAGSCGYTGAAACNFYDGFGYSGAGQSIVIPVNVADVSNVYTLVNAYDPNPGVQLASVEFVGSAGATLTVPLIGGSTIRDFLLGGYTNTLNNTTSGVTALNAFTVQNVQGGGGSSDVNTGIVGTYHIDEQDFTLGPAFATQTLQSIVFTDSSNGSVPILLGVTVQRGSASSSPGNTSQSSGASQSQRKTAQTSTITTTQSTAPQSFSAGEPEPGTASPPPASVVQEGSAPIAPGSGTGSGGGAITSVTDMDSGAGLFSEMVPNGDSGSTGEPITVVAPWTTAPHVVPLPQSTTDPVGGAGSHLERERVVAVPPQGVAGIADGAPAAGNRALWFASGQ